MEEISDISGISGEMDYLNPNATSNCPKRRRSTAITEKFGAFLSPWGKRSAPGKLYPWNTHPPSATNNQIFVSEFGMFFRKFLSHSNLDCQKNLMSNPIKTTNYPSLDIDYPCSTTCHFTWLLSTYLVWLLIELLLFGQHLNYTNKIWKDYIKLTYYQVNYTILCTCR